MFKCPSRTVSPLILFALFLVANYGCESQKPEEFVARAEERVAAGDVRAAIIELKAGLQRYPDNAYGRMLLGRTYLKVGDGASAEKELLRAVRVGAADEVIRADLAQAYRLQGKWEEILARAVSDSLDTPDRVSLHVSRGYAYLGQHDAEAALREFEAASVVDPGAVEAVVGQAVVALQQGARKRVAELLDRAIELDPASASANRVRGDMAWKYGDYDAADRAYTDAIKSAALPQDLELRRLMVRLAAGRFEQAAADVDRLKSELSSHHILMHAEGILRYRARAFGDAQLLFSEALSRGSEDPQTLFFLGASHLAQGNYESARNYLEKFVGKMPQSKQGKLAFAMTQLRLNEFDAALESVQPVLSEEPENTLALSIKANAVMGNADGVAPENWLLLAPESTPALSRNAAGVDEVSSLVAELAPGSVRGGRFSSHQFTADQLAGALNSALDFLRQHPDSANANAVVGALYLLKRDAVNARSAFEKARAIDPGEQTANSGLAALAILDGNLDLARSHYEAILAEHPNAIGSALNLAALAAAEGNVNSMLSTLEQARRNNPDSIEPAIWLGRYYLKQGQPEKALPQLREASGQQPENAVLAVFYGRLLLAAGQQSAALRHLEAFLSTNPGNAEAIYLNGKAKQKLGQVAAANEDYQRAVAINPLLHEARYDLADTALALGNLTLAESSLAALVDGVGESPDLLLLQAKVAGAKGDSSTMVKKLGRRFAIQGNNINLIAYVAARWEAGERREALEDLEGWLEDYPNDSLIRLELANRRMALGDIEPAIMAYELVLENETVDHLPALNNLAWLLLEKDPKRALEYAKEARRLAPNSLAVMDTLAMSWLASGNAGQALLMSDEAIAAGGVSPALRYHRAQILATLEQRHEARQLLEELLASAQPFAQREAAEMLLRSLGE